MRLIYTVSGDVVWFEKINEEEFLVFPKIDDYVPKPEDMIKCKKGSAGKPLDLTKILAEAKWKYENKNNFKEKPIFIFK